ncbi:MAG: riboflavin synthase [Saprospiraceae bacterium]|nr:riboflavin synthase [Saprospiraceae bacterium]
MFTGIVEDIAILKSIEKEGTNLHLNIQSRLNPELYIDQSIAHNGVCLTVVKINDDSYIVTAVKETLERSNLGKMISGDPINLERSVQAGSRMDGHFVQGHVDTMAVCESVTDENGSWSFTFRLDGNQSQYLVDKGSVCVNGVSLTVVNPENNLFSVAIIPYTYEHTNFKNIHPGDYVNIEFDILGKYIVKYLSGLKIL